MQNEHTSVVPNASMPWLFTAGNAAAQGAGRPRRGETFRDVIQRLADQPAAPGSRLSQREAIVALVFGLARRGVPWAIQWLVERLEGKAPIGIAIAQVGGANPLSALTDQQLLALVEGKIFGSLTNPGSGQSRDPGSPSTRDTNSHQKTLRLRKNP